MSPHPATLLPSDDPHQKARPLTMRQPFLSSRLRCGAPALFLVAGLPGSGMADPNPAFSDTALTALSGQVMTADGQPLVNGAGRDGHSGTRTAHRRRGPFPERQGAGRRFRADPRWSPCLGGWQDRLWLVRDAGDGGCRSDHGTAFYQLPATN